jgi:hypothetical protein
MMSTCRKLRSALAASTIALAGAELAGAPAVAQEPAPAPGSAPVVERIQNVERVRPGEPRRFVLRNDGGEVSYFGFGDAATGQAIALVEGDPIRVRMFPPELIMEHAAAIDLSAEQREAIIRIAEQSQSRTTRLHLETRAARAELVEALDQTPTDVDAVLEVLDRTLEHERQVKLENFAMLLRIRDELTEEQQELLRREAGPSFGLTATKVIAPFSGVVPTPAPPLVELGEPE